MIYLMKGLIMEYRGTILFPGKYNSRSSVRYTHFFRTFAEKNNFLILEKDNVTLEQMQGEIYIGFKAPQHDCFTRGRAAAEFPKNIKVIFFPVDLQYVDSPTIPEYRIRFENVLKRADKIICPYKEAFFYHWPQYTNKFEWFPQYFSPEEWYRCLPSDNRKINKCLIPGFAGLDYPMRRELYKHLDICDGLIHTKYQQNMVVQNGAYYEDYPKKLNEYICCFTCCSRFKYPLAKYFEIPAAGSLLVAERCKDIDELGFVPGKHYIAVTMNNMLEKIKNIINNPEKYINILEEGRKFVLNNYGVNKRIEQLERIVNNL